MIEKKEAEKIIKKAPHAPGVYKMLNDEDIVIYIGKAKDLNKRLKQYFQKNYQHSSRTKKLLEKMTKINFTSVDSELEAMILETNLIKQFKPKYNILMKDDKNYVYIKITKEDFPRIQIVREIKKDKAKYIGPKTAAHKVKETFKVLKKIFPFRHCGLDIESLEGKKVKVTKKVLKYPCLDYYIKRCIAPCIGSCTKEEYKKIIDSIEKFLEGKADFIIKDLEKQMQAHAKNKNFEKAAKTRDKLQKVKDILEKQKVADPNQSDKDIINYCIIQGKAYFNLFQIRDGKLIGQENFILTAEEIEEESHDPEVLEAFLKQYYGLATDLPKEILLPHEIESKKELEIKLSNEKGRKVKILIPKQGIKDRLLEMSAKNARIYADRNKPSWKQESELTKKAAEELQKLLKIKTPLGRIECYDISHLSGTETVGSMIVFQNGAPKNEFYRRFKLKTVQGKPDDYKSMEEVLTRRFSKIALTAKHQEYTFKKSRKKDKEFIEKNNSIDLETSERTFYILEKKDKLIGFIATKEYSPKVAELTNLWISKKERGRKLGHKLVKSAIEKIKAKRVYGICKKELTEYYQLMGFDEIKQLPEELLDREKECRIKHKEISFIVYDKNKHKPDKSFTQIPDLVVIDGGKGQLSSAAKIFKKYDLKIPHISLAKQIEEIFVPGKQTSIILERNNEALKLLQRARDEAHRFAITYNRNLRAKKFRK